MFFGLFKKSIKPTEDLFDTYTSLIKFIDVEKNEKSIINSKLIIS